MEYSELISEATNQKHAPDSSYFAYSIATFLYVKDSSVELSNLAIFNVGSPIKTFHISPNSKFIAIYLNKKSTILVYPFNDPSTLIAKIQDTQQGISSFFWAKDSFQLLVFSEFMYKVSIYNFSTKSVVQIKGPKLSSGKGCAFNSNGKFMALIEKHDCKEFLSIYYTADWKLVNTFSLDLFDAVEVRWSPNDSYIAIWDNCINYRMLIFCHANGLVKKYEPYNDALGIKSVEFSHNSLFLAIGSFDEKIRLLNALTWKQIGDLDCSLSLLNPQNIKILRENQNGKGMKEIQGNTYRIPLGKIGDQKPPNQGVSQIQFSSDDFFLACKNDNMPSSLWIWNVSKLEPVALLTFNSAIKSFKWSKAGNSIAIICGSDKLVIWKQSQITECFFKFENVKFGIQKMIWSEDGKKILISSKSDLVYVQLTQDITS